MKITIEHYDEKVTVETKNDDLTISEVVDHLYGLCIAAGYDKTNVGEAFYDKGEIETANYNTMDTLCTAPSGMCTLYELDIEPYDGLLRDDIPLAPEI